MAYASLAIGNLSVPLNQTLYSTPYVVTKQVSIAGFVARLYTDSGYSTLAGTSYCDAVKGNSAFTQADLIMFTGLHRGVTYYLEVAPVSPSGEEGAVNRYPFQAGSIDYPTCTYTGTFTSTPSGITYDIHPNNVPANIDHFEAIWTKDGSQPNSNSLMNYWTGMPSANGVITLFASGYIGQTVTLFMRGISSNGGYQDWVPVDNRAISSGSSGTISAGSILYDDGRSVQSLQPAQAGADKTGVNTAAGIINQGALATINIVNTQNILAGAVNTQIFYTSSVQVLCQPNTTTRLATATFGTAGGYVKCLFSMQLSIGSGTDEPTIRMWKVNNDGTTTLLNEYYSVFCTTVSGGGRPCMSFHAVDNTPPPTGTYYVELINESNSTVIYCDSIYFSAENAKV